jgi:RHS repeat-associated protein
MKNKNKLILILVAVTLITPGQLFLNIGLGNLRADCPSSPSTANNQSTNGNQLVALWGGGVPAIHALIGYAVAVPMNEGPLYTSPPPPARQGGGYGGSGFLPIVDPTVPNLHATSPAAVVNTSNGDFVYQATDISVAGVMPLEITRYYVSSMAYNGPMGYNFDFNYNRSLELQSGCAYYHTGKGYKIQLNYGTDHSHAQSVGSALHLSLSPAVAFTMNDSAGGLAHVLVAGGYQVADPHGNRDIFDSTGRLRYAVDRNGNGQIFGRDSAGRLTSVVDFATSRSLVFTLDSNGRITAITDSNGRVVSYTYDTSYNLTKITYPASADFPLGTTNQFSYDLDDRMTAVSDGNGYQIIENSYGGPGTATEFEVTDQYINGGHISYVYGTNEITRTDGNGFVTDSYNDASGNVTRQVVHTAGLHSGEPSTYETDYAYDSNNQLTQVTYPKGNKTVWSYDGNGDILTIANSVPSGVSVDSSKGTQATTSTTTYTYETRFYQVASMTDPNGNVTTYDYGTATSNPNGNLLSVTAPTTAAGTAHATFTYDVYGHVLTATAPDGTVTQNTYASPIDSLTKTIKDYGAGKLNATSQYTYDAYGHLATIQDPNGNTTTITTNERDLVTEIDRPNGQVSQFSYDAAGNMIARQQKLGTSDWQKVTTVYNSHEQATQVLSYTGTSTYVYTSFAYDLNGNPTTTTDPLGHATSLAYDERNLPYLKTDALGKTTKTDFDANGNTTKLTDELGHITTYTYDGFNALEEKTFADSSYQTWKYDAGGRLTSQRTTAGNTITKSYDARNELTSENYGSTITPTYDILGRLLTATEGGTSITYAYDALGRNTSFTDQAGHTSTYTYDLNGNRLTAAYPTGVTAHGSYDASNRLLTLKDDSGATLTTNTYDSLDRLTAATLGNSSTVTPGYDLLNRITGLTDALNTGSRAFSNIYDSDSRIYSKTTPRGTVNVAYDNRDEVTGLTEPSGSPFADQSFVFDAAFNRSSWTQGSTTTSYTVNNINQFSAIASATPTWNSDGGLASYGGNSYVYDALGRLIEVDYSSGKTLYFYDPFGRRVKKINENTSGTVLSTYQYHYDGSQVAVEYQPSTTWTYYGGLMRTDGTHQQWYYRDTQGNVSAVADGSGNLLEAYEYNAQGQFQITNGSGTVLSTTAIGNDLLYGNYRYDSETGNYFCNARYYNPTLGRFISRDPLSGAEYSQGTNLYAYCGNDPVNGSDPSGMNHWVYYPALGGGERYWVADAPSASISKTGPGNTFNPLLFSVGAINIFRGGIKMATGVGALGAAVVTVPAPPAWWADPVLLGYGAWNLNGGRTLISRGVNEMFASPNSDSRGDWQNLLGLLPFGGNFDTPGKSSTGWQKIQNQPWYDTAGELATGLF